MVTPIFNRLKLATTPKIVRRLFPEAIWSINTVEKVVYLTFDDGPQVGVTEKVIDLLQEYNAKATFFCIGDNVTKYPTIYQKILDAGHAVGNHTYNHLKGSQTNNDQYFNNIKKCSTVVKSKLFRPPYGRIKKSQYNQLKKEYRIILWSVLSWDFDTALTPQICAKKVLNNIQNGSVIVFHDSKKAEINCLGALEIVLIDLTKKGYHFLPLMY